MLQTLLVVVVLNKETQLSRSIEAWMSVAEWQTVYTTAYMVINSGLIFLQVLELSYVVSIKLTDVS